MTTNDLLVHVYFAESYRNDQQDEIQSAYFGDQSFSLFTSCCYYITDTDNLGQKSVVVVTEKSDHNRITSMSCLEKVIETIETQCGKFFNNIVVWSDGMGAQFSLKFIFQLLAGNLFPDKSLSWYYNERHHGKGPMDGVGGTIKNVIFRKVKSGHVVVYAPNQFADAAFVPRTSHQFTYRLRRKSLNLETLISHQLLPRRSQYINLSGTSTREVSAAFHFSRQQ